jgi:hypothetical protein
LFPSMRAEIKSVLGQSLPVSQARLTGRLTEPPRHFLGHAAFACADAPLIADM